MNFCIRLQISVNFCKFLQISDPGLANYEMPDEECEGNFWGTVFRHRDSGTDGSREPPGPVKGIQAILLTAGLRYLGLGT